MAGKAAMAEPAQHVPAQTPARHADREFRFGAEGAPPTLARGVWTAYQTVDHLGRPLERPESMIPVVAHMHITVADRARAILNFQRNPFDALIGFRGLMLTFRRFEFELLKSAELDDEKS